MYTNEKTVEKCVCSHTELNKSTPCAHGPRTQTNTVQCAGGGGAHEYCLRPVCFNYLRPWSQIRISPVFRYSLGYSRCMLWSETDPGKTSPMSLMIMRSTLLVLLLAAGAGALEYNLAE